jgi:transposase InsO family protein
VLDSERFIDQPPREVYGTLLTEGTFLCSIRTMYRLLAERGPVKERRAHRERANHPVPRLVAEAPNAVWSWDISKLPTLITGVFLNLYVVLDIFSRYVVAWMVASHENSALAKQLFAEAIKRYGIEPGHLIVHQDRGAPMTSHGFADLLDLLGIERSYSRPRVSNDNPWSESLFHTGKYQPDYPGRFQDLGHARRYFGDFFAWYNDDHCHDGIALFTPADVYFGRVDTIIATRQAALLEAYDAHPERFVHGPPKAARPPERVLLNPPGDPITADRILSARPEELSALWPTTPLASTTPAINLPGVPPRPTGGAPAQPFPT